MYPGWPVTTRITESVTGHAAVYPVRKEHTREQVKEKSKQYRRKEVTEQESGCNGSVPHRTTCSICEAICTSNKGIKNSEEEMHIRNVSTNICS